ncbi:hypothetical protein POJ06DRAFT_255622 [Lipomyces tetrasporus]|uniref:Uncharacterized protein n=1 Tax=Lipomyces tetrasporus TaxID=54092 RepID=A0AAD7QRL4_9ASCO|nr:uncharacterized protein POJ06DRAFT_255622 [Lipomyces tetrasporus]KAJ8100169.1 hypothetical protein POJ06DRAFT_255622 [Lipomyces tetrasporus]
MSRMSSNRFSVADQARQSHPIDPSEPFNLSWVTGKTIVITGGASGFGASFFKKWATAGANVIIGDVDDAKGESIVRTVRTATDNRNHHYLHCDVTDWQSQVNFFKQASKLSPHGGIDAVVANAGVVDVKAKFNEPENLDMDDPPKPDMRVIEVNLVGVLYTTHLALFYLPRNPGSEPADPNKSTSNIEESPRDRHLLLIGSMASLLPIPQQTLYGAAKHGVLGLFRSLRITAFTKGVRVNMVCPYFVDTGILTPAGRMLLAGTSLAQVEDVVEAGSRLMADSRISGRNLVVGPRLSIVKTEQGEWQYCRKEENQNCMEVSLWEVQTDDLETSDVFMRRVIGLMNAAQEMRGWILWTKDIAKVLFTWSKSR